MCAALFGSSTGDAGLEFGVVFGGRLQCVFQRAVRAGGGEMDRQLRPARADVEGDGADHHLRRQPHHPRFGGQHHRRRVGAAAHAEVGFWDYARYRHPGHDPDDGAGVAILLMMG